MSRATEALWDADQVGEYLGVSRSTVYQFRRRDFPPAIRLWPKTVRWRPEQVRAWLRHL